MILDCQSIRQALAEHLTQGIEVQPVRETWVATLPISTLDNRLVDIFVEPRAADIAFIHDGGKAVNELIVQGIHITDSISREFALLASAMGVHYRDEMFGTAVKLNEFAKSAYAVAMCSAIAMHRLLDHKIVEQETSLHLQVGTILKNWGKQKGNVSEHVKVQGDLRQHTFDYMLDLKKGPSIALSILNPTGGPLAAAERFGFRAQDIKNSKPMRLVAVESRAEIWTPDARRIVDRFAHGVIQVPSGAPADERQVAAELNRIASVA